MEDNNDDTDNTTWNKERKLKLLKIINKIKKKEHVKQIYKIIKNSGHQYTKNKNGVFFLFHNLKEETYNELENYIMNIHANSMSNAEDQSSIVVSL